MTLTKAIVYAAGLDAGNRNAKAARRSKWNNADYNAASDEVWRVIDQIGLDAWLELPAR